MRAAIQPGQPGYSMRSEPRHRNACRKSPEHRERISRGHLERWQRIRAERRAAGLPQTAEEARRLAAAAKRAELQAEREAQREARRLAALVAPEQYTPINPDADDGPWRLMTVEERTDGYWEALEAREAEAAIDNAPQSLSGASARRV